MEAFDGPGVGVGVGDGTGVGTGVGDGVVPGVGVAVGAGVGVGLEAELTEPHPVARAKMEATNKMYEPERSLREFIEYLNNCGGTGLMLGKMCSSSSRVVAGC